MQFKRNLNVNQDGKLPVKEHFHNSDVVVMFDYDFTERIYEYDYITLSDIMSSVGGLLASITPLFKILTPLLIVHFLHTLGTILLEKYQEDYRADLIKLAQLVEAEMLSQRRLRGEDCSDLEFISEKTNEELYAFVS